MAHHDFYSSLGLDRTKDSAALSAEIDARLKAEGLSDAVKDELQVGWKILGDPRRRALYDAKLDDPASPPITVAALRNLAALDLGPAPAEPSATVGHPEKPAAQTGKIDRVVAPNDTGMLPLTGGSEPARTEKPANIPGGRPRQYFPSADPRESAPATGSLAAPVSAPTASPAPLRAPGYAYPPHHQQPHAPTSGYSQPAPAPAAPASTKKQASVSLIIVAALAVAAAGAGGWWLWENRGTAWSAQDQQLADAFPRVVSKQEGQRGWYDMKCRSMPVEPGQTARVRCSDSELGVSVMDYGTDFDRDAALPEGDYDTLVSGQCSARSYRLENVSPPAYAIAPEGPDARYLLVVNGEDAQAKRLRLNLCEKSR